jgi:hypothetical protein
MEEFSMVIYFLKFVLIILISFFSSGYQLGTAALQLKDENDKFSLG